MDRIERIMKCCEYDHMMESSKWIQKIPFIKFKKDWSVRVMPPFGGAIIRFCVLKGDESVSIYLDCYDQIGSVGSPYWEVYGHGQPERCAMNDVASLLKLITKHLKPYKNK